MVERGLALVRLGALTLADYVRKASLEPARMLALPGKGQLGVGADADITVLDLERGCAVVSLVAGDPIMVEGRVVGSGGVLLTTEAGAEIARRAKLRYQVVDPAGGLMYRS
jgi:predicted amidohydrolase